LIKVKGNLKDIKLMLYIIRLTIVIILSFNYSPIYAKTTPESARYLIIHGISKHFNSVGKQYNEKNYTIGYEYTQQNRLGWVVFGYRDSYRTIGKAFGVIIPSSTYHPTTASKIDLGWFLGVIHSPSYLKGRTGVFILPRIALYWKDIGLNLYIAPRLGNNVNSILGLQFKINLH
jgi:hypothetical protein